MSDQNPNNDADSGGPCEVEIAVCKNLALYGVLEEICPCSDTLVIPERGPESGNEVPVCTDDGPFGGYAAAAASYCKYNLGIGEEQDIGPGSDPNVDWPLDLQGCRYAVNRCCCVRLQDCAPRRPKCTKRAGACKKKATPV